MLQPRAFRFDAHIDVFRHETHKCGGEISTQAQGHVDDTVVVGLIFVGIKEGYLSVIGNQLIGKDGQRTQPMLIKIGTWDFHSALYLARRRTAHHFVYELNRYPRFAAHAFVTSILDVIEFFEDSHGDHHVMLGEGCHRSGVMQQYVGIQDVNLPVCSFELSDFVGLGCSQRHESSSGAKVKSKAWARGVAPHKAHATGSLGKILGCEIRDAGVAP